MITTRELASLASKLARQKSHEKQEVGRALLRAITGEIWAQGGQRNATAYKISAECVEAYPLLDPGTVVECFAASISNASLAGSKMTREKWCGMLERLQGERQTRITMAREVGGKLGDALLQRASAVTEPAPFGAPTSAPVADERAQALNEAGPHTLMILNGPDFYLRTPDVGTFDHRLTSQLHLQVQLARLFGTVNGTVVTHAVDAKGDFKPIEMSELCRVYGSVAKKVAYDYTAPSTTFDLATSTLQIGFPLDLPEAKPCELTHAWLLALSGYTDASCSELYSWIAGCARAYIHRPAAALALVGRKDTGKSLFATLIASTWGLTPVDLCNAVERFNGALIGSPFWHADERMPADMTDASFRKIVQDRVRHVEPKGREKVELRGCGRLIFTLNEVEDMRLGSVEGAEAIEAVADRIAFFDTRDQTQEIVAALDALRLPGGYDVDAARMVRHFRWVQETYTPRDQRFIGTRLSNEAIRSAIVQQATYGHEGVLDSIVDYLVNPLAWEKTYRAVKSNYADDGNRFPIIVSEGCLFVWLGELAQRLRCKDHSAPMKATRAMQGKRRDLKFCAGKHRANYREIDLARLLEARGIAPGSELYALAITTLACDTIERCPELA